MLTAARLMQRASVPLRSNVAGEAALSVSISLPRRSVVGHWPYPPPYILYPYPYP